jgi:hypothetical protein
VAGRQASQYIRAVAEVEVVGHGAGRKRASHIRAAVETEVVGLGGRSDSAPVTSAVARLR